METLLHQIHDSWLNPERASSGAKHVAAFLALTLLLTGSALALGPYPITKFPEDTLYFLSQGELLLKGYRSSVDFYSMHGPFPFLFAAFGISVHGISLHSVVLAQVAGAVVFGCIMFKVASDRVNGFWSVALAMAVELLLISCTPIGGKSWREFTCAMWYNSIGYCVFAIVFLYLLAPARSSARWKSSTDDALVGFSLGALFLTKLSYFLPAAIVFTVGTVILPRPPLSRMRGIGVLAAAAAAAWAISTAIGGSLGQSYALIESLSLKVSPLTTSLRFAHYTRTIGILGLGLALVVWMAKESGQLQAITREAILAILMVGTVLVAASTSAQDQEMLPLIGVVPLGLIICLVGVIRSNAAHVNQYLLTASLCIALLLVVHEPKNSLLSWFFSHANVAVTMAPKVEFFELRNSEGAKLLADDVDRELLTKFPSDEMSEHFAGMTLLKRAGSERDQILFVASDYSPINMLTGMRYPVGTVIWWPSSFVGSPDNSTLIEPNYLADVDFILRDAKDEVYWQFLMHHRGDYFKRHFRRIAEDSPWILYARRQAAETSY